LSFFSVRLFANRRFYRTVAAAEPAPADPEARALWLAKLVRAAVQRDYGASIDTNNVVHVEKCESSCFVNGTV
jgi:hypothetical protein